MGDIGEKFSNKNKKFKNISSNLEENGKEVKKQNIKLIILI